MTIVLYAIIAFGVNAFIGAVVWAALDCEDERFYHWYKSCPPEIAWFAQPLVLTLWPVAVYLWWKETK